MLVLSREIDQKIIIGDGIIITVVKIQGDKVRLGIEAPSDVPVHRQEVYEAIRRQEQDAARDRRLSEAMKSLDTSHKTA